MRGKFNVQGHHQAVVAPGPYSYNQPSVQYSVEKPKASFGVHGPKGRFGVEAATLKYTSKGGELSTYGPTLGN